MTQVPPTGSRFGAYRIDDRIGMGGMGVVYAATDTRLDRRVALKLVSGQLAGDPSFVARFQREAEVLARLDSPHIVAIFDHGEQDGTPYIATQYVAGGDLGALITGRGALPPQLALRVCAQIAEALADAHRVGVIHRDVKPGNVLLRDPDAPTLHAYLCDFGIAQTESQGLTTAGAIAGSWAYLAPERARGETATAASDVYAVGCLLWACLTGSAPYVGSDVEVAMAHVSAPVPQLAGEGAFLQDLNALLARALAKDPAARFAGADDLRDALAGLADRAGGRPPVEAPPAWRRSWAAGETDPPTRTRPATPWWRRTPLVAALALALVAGIGVAAWLVLRGDEPTGRSPLVRGITGDTDGDGNGDLRGYYVASGFQDLTFDSDGFSVKLAGEDEGERGQRVHGDFDGDGLDDVLVVDDDELPRLNWTITYADGRTVDGDWQWQQPHDARPIAVAGDFDGDDVTDVALYANPANTISQMGGKAPDAGEFRVYVATSDREELDPELSLWFTRPTGWGRNDVRLVPGAFDADDAEDLAVVRQGALIDPDRDTALWELTLLRAGTLGFDAAGTPLVEPDASSRPARLAPGDFDGDGTDEIAFVGHGDADAITMVRWVDDLFTASGAPWGNLDHTEAVGITDVAVSDLDGDGADDLAWFGEAGFDSRDLRGAFADGDSFDVRDIGTWSCSSSCDEGSLVGYYPED